ncbi:MAG TPA: hypothetical protein VMW50_02965 [Dehalococcoidia bacterium]|nr:hypothetical protein [Dehalococcoidia bacterium]
MPKLPCPKYPEKCKTAQRCGVDIASGACTYDPNIKGMYKKCCVTENTEPPVILISYSKESIYSQQLRSKEMEK